MKMNVLVVNDLMSSIASSSTYNFSFNIFRYPGNCVDKLLIAPIMNANRKSSHNVTIKEVKALTLRAMMQQTNKPKYGHELLELLRPSSIIQHQTPTKRHSSPPPQPNMMAWS